MKKIAFLTSDISSHGGTQRVISTLANAFSEKLKYKVYIYSLNQSSNKTRYSINDEIGLINLQYKYSLLKFNKIRKEINRYNKQYNIDTIMGIGCYFNLLLPFIECKNKIACEHNSYDLPSLKTRIMRNIAYRYVDKVVSLTEEDKAKYSKINKNTYVIPNPLSFSCNQSKTRENVIISIGTLEERKGLDRLLKIWEKIEQKNFDYKLEIYGDGPEKNNLINLNNELGLKNVYFKGNVNNVEEVLSKSKIFLLTSKKEGFPMVILEAMECGVPVIAYDIKTGPKEIINNEVDGFLISNNDEETFVSKIEYLILNEEILNELSINAKKNIARFNLDKIILRWKKIIETNIQGEI